jgi:hypothetical protein
MMYIWLPILELDIAKQVADVHFSSFLLDS